MAYLFKNKKIREDLEKYEIPDLEGKIAKVKTWYDSYENKSLHQKTESQCEQAFNQHFFIEILGYTSFPNETYTIDPKGTADASSQKADAVLGYFGEDEKRVTAVVEIKDVNTSLERSQQRAGNMSPIQQAFKYKPQYKDCAFVIATNFFEIRLFRDNQLDYESFTLETLVDPKDNYYEFRKFYYLLNAENFVIKHGKSVTEKLLAEIRIEQEKITKSFYKDYKDLRQSLINNLVKNGKGLDFDIVVEKAQKIIDRIVFICFCEDLDMLPENKLKEVVHHTEKMGLEIPVWDIMKGFFKAIDKGSKKLEIPKGYNGELFKVDAVLDGLFVDDAICKRFVELGKYDFSEDLSVDILGHIFEQSISDIEELKSFVEQKEVDKKKSKRKKDGIFYTPDYIVDYIVKNSLGAYLEEKEKELMKKHGLKEDIKGKNYEKRALKVFQEYQDVLENVKVLDPACGSGAFLVKVFDYLLAENKRVADVIADLSGGNKELFSDEGYIKELLENNIYGVDLNPESVEITKLSLWLKTAIRGKKLVNLKNNIKCGNSLIDDPEVAGKRAFKWEEEFKEIMESGGFDVVVGNPPYVRQELLGKENKEYYQKKFANTCEYTADLYVYFIELALLLLKSKGRMSFITPNKWMERKYGFKLRKYLKEFDIEQIVNFGELKIFEDASTEPSIIVIRKSCINDYIKCSSITSLDEARDSQSYSLKKYRKSILRDDIWRFVDPMVVKILEKFKEKAITLDEYTSGGVFYGIKTGFNKAFILRKNVVSKIIGENNLSKEIIKKMVEGDDFGKWALKNPKRYMLATGYDIDVKKKYPAVYNFLSQYKKELIERKDQGKSWYNLRACDYYDELEKPKIIYYHTALNHSFYFDEEGYYISANCYFISNADRYLQCILNSKLFNFVKKYLFPAFGNAESGGRVRLDANKMTKLPIKNVNSDKKKKFEKLSIIISNLSKDYNNKLQVTLKVLQHEFSVEKISQKIEKFYELDFDGFVKALKLKKLSLDKKEELLEFFEKHKKELVEVKNRIDATDKEIDKMVFDLYGLSEEERGVISNN